MSVAFVFPGQGAQTVGMCQELYETSAAARDVFGVASEALGYDVAGICFEDPDDVLNVTEYTQPVLLTACIAAYEAFRERCPGIVPAFTAGLSLGEYASLVIAGSLEFADAVRLTQLRGRAMQAAVPRGIGGMAAVVGLEGAKVLELCGTVSTTDAWVEPANYNCPGQVVVAGHTAAVKALCAVAKQAGASKALSLPVSAPFHNRLLRPAGERLAEALRSVPIQAPNVPVVANVSARPLREADDVKESLIAQVYSPVLMEQSLRFILNQGVSLFVEFGPGRTVSGFGQKIRSDVETIQVSDPAGVALATARLNHAC